MEDPTTKPSGSKPASPSRTYSETDRSEVNTPDGLAPAVCASRLPAAGGSHVAEPWSCCWLPKIGIIAPCQSSLAQSLVLRGAQVQVRVDYHEVHPASLVGWQHGFPARLRPRPVPA